MSAEPTFHQLRIFIALWDTRSVNKSAEMLGMTASQVSINLKKLRDYYDDELFIKKFGAFQPTSKAESLYIEFEEILRRLEITRNPQEKEAEKPQRRTIKLAVNEYALMVIVPRLIDYLGEMQVGGFDDITLDVETLPPNMNANDMYVLLQEKGIDLVIDYPSETVSLITAMPLLKDHWIVAGSADEFLCDYSVDDFHKQNIPFIVSKTEYGPRLKRLIDSLNVVASLPTMYHVANTISNTKYLSILPEKVMGLGEVGQNLRHCAYPGAPLEFEVHLFTLKRSVQDDQIKLLTMALQACCAAA